MKLPLSRRDFLTRSASATTAISVVALTQEKAFAASAKPIKIGQIGVGHSHAERNLEAYRNSPDFEVVGVVEPDEALRQDVAEKEAYRDLPWLTQEQLLNEPGLEAVAVETKVAGLLDAAELCVEAGKHVHLDKPAGESLPQFKRILADADRQGLTLQMGYMYRYNPGITMLREFLERGWLGEVFEIHCVMSKVVGDAKRRRWVQYPGGTMFELGCHLVDLVIGVLGRPEKVTPFNQHAGQQEDTLLDNMLAVFTYPRAMATVKSSALEVEGFERRHFVVCGTEGTFHIQPLDKPSVRLALEAPRGSYTAEYQQVDVGPYERFIADAADFAQIIRGEKKADYSSAHDLAVQGTLLMACGLDGS